VHVEVPDGDVVDRITILELKVARLRRGQDAAQAELEALQAAWKASSHPPFAALPETDALRAVNARLWDVEDALREHEARGVFDAAFVALARSVYRLNDERARLKRAISETVGSRLVEQKSYRGAAGPTDSTGLSR
jgi:hypothetical protein